MWRYFLPTKMLSGEGVLKKEKDNLFKSNSAAFIVTGRNSARACGALDDLYSIFKEKGIDSVLFDSVEENPSFDTIRKATKLARSENCDFVVAIGGGSPMDAAKAIAVLAKNSSLGVEDLYDSSKYNAALPLIAIPTTSGTGSEVTQYSVLTDDEGNKRGFGSTVIFPKVAVLDPVYTVTMNEHVTVATALDALSHSVEGEILNDGVNLFVKTLSKEATSIIRKTLPKAVLDLNNVEYRKSLHYAATLAGIVIAHTGTTVVHASGYPLSSSKRIKHGIANSMFMVDVLEKIGEENLEKVINGIEPFASLEELREFYDRFGIYDIKVEMTDDELESWTKKSFAAKHNKRTPGSFSESFYRTLYEKVREY